jgi:hypothetical protein
MMSCFVETAIMITTMPIRNLHLEYKFWIVELNFYREMLDIFQSHLETVVRENPENRKIRPQVEHFQNQFFLQREVIDELKHDLNISEKQLAIFTREMSLVGYEFERLDNHSVLRDKFLTFRKIFNELKEEFHHFESECL